MDPVQTDFDPNKYYRFINLARGPSVSLDVVNPPDGSLFFGPTGLYGGQVWQLLKADTSSFYISGQFLGPKLKLDVLPNERGDLSPFLRNYTSDYNQTWTLTPHLDELAWNQTTWTMAPDFIGGGGAQNVVSVYEDTIGTPFLAPYVAYDPHQRWLVVMESIPVNDPTFSLSNLPALATEVCCSLHDQELQP